ncbi:hypothetical protein [Helicobacter pylori]|uniref:hypothetical protein n=2 Tax=Helicobacter pylori TaxID=210 RepID=UPI00292777E3|nr:hypothetical protein [Helicobacter pylori]MCQ2870635.1 hypothetical protein [Helicobacter pylori]MDU9791665.1 hypothetical protein [Helicobacter pylori]WQW92974.1 hypothetical protein FE361_03690 [Helicobacter pylori]WRB36757.1 hypothetical protein KVL41_03920 [Helicobacter pylori]
MIESLEKGGSFNQRDREKFAQTARTLGIEYSVIEEMIDIYQTLHFAYLHEDLIDASDLPREQKKTVHAELQKSIDENLKALKSIRHDILMRDLLRDLPHMSSLWRFAFDHVFKVQEILNNKK